MGRNRSVEQHRILHLTGIADDTVIPDQDMFADVGIMAHLAISADDGRTFDHGPVLDHGSFPDKNLLAYKGDPFATVMQPGAEMGGDVAGDFGNRFPCVFAVFKNFGVFGLAKIEQVSSLKHALNFQKMARVKRQKWKAL
jgi:hypothetical protein